MPEDVPDLNMLPSLDTPDLDWLDLPRSERIDASREFDKLCPAELDDVERALWDCAIEDLTYHTSYVRAAFILLFRIARMRRFLATLRADCVMDGATTTVEEIDEALE